MNLLRLHKNLLPLLALAALCLYTILVTLFSKVYYEGAYFTRTFDFRHYLAFAAVALNLVVYFCARPWFKFTLIGMLLPGLLDLLSFTPDRISLGFGVTDAFRLSIQPLSLLFIAAYYFLNRTSSRRFLRAYVLPAPTQQRATHYQEQVTQFKATLGRKPDDSLRLMLHDEKLVAAAREAAKQLLHERENTKSSISGKTEN
ncbi:hypothetical protein [Hymenobacter jeollabukensis]|uniref:Uncharacterized protein n=1 Tax=Hymenobacter jeollabukensis TaxID=2025313 RepID=A0A5R8WPS0_9BACT|nr:hypothetical protein [Hymenobacter jeollabukensis]TLM91753.1 hypothetical protein FDY95_14425 [Hymenobacter jeollabukensis]